MRCAMPIVRNRIARARRLSDAISLATGRKNKVSTRVYAQHEICFLLIYFIIYCAAPKEQPEAVLLIGLNFDQCAHNY